MYLHPSAVFLFSTIVLLLAGFSLIVLILNSGHSANEKYNGKLNRFFKTKKKISNYANTFRVEHTCQLYGYLLCPVETSIKYLVLALSTGGEDKILIFVQLHVFLSTLLQR